MNLEQVFENKKKLNCRSGKNCSDVKLGKCKFYHEPCRSGRQCQFVRTQQCRSFHPIEQIYCPRQQTCLVEGCKYKHPCSHL